MMGQTESITERAEAEGEQPLLLNKARAKSLRQEGGRPLCVSSPCRLQPRSLTARAWHGNKSVGIALHTLRQEMQ